MTRTERAAYRRAKALISEITAPDSQETVKISHLTKPMTRLAVGVSLSAVTDAIAKGRLRSVLHYGVELIPVDDVARWVARRKIAAAKDVLGRLATRGGE